MKHYNKIPLTQNQELLWLGQELNPESPMYNMVMRYDIKAEVSYPSFNLAFSKLVATNDALRSTFELDNGIPTQKFSEFINVTVPLIDLSDEDHPETAYQNWENNKVKNIFDLTKCLFDTALIKISNTHFIWYINQHHLITDGWSTTIMFSQMSNLYQKIVTNSDVVLNPPSYKDFITYTQECKKSDTFKDIQNHWKAKQEKFPSAPNLYYKKNTLLDTKAKRLHINLGKARTDKIHQLATIRGIKGWGLDLTLYNIFLTTLFAFAYRVSGQPHLVIGSPTHNRLTKNFKNTLGYFVETFPMESEISEDETFMSLIKKVALESNSFLKHAKVGTSTAELNRDFNLFFNYINTAITSFNETPVFTKWVHPGHHDPRHHLRLHVHDFDHTGNIQLYFDLNTNVFDAEKQQEVPQHFLKILDAFIEDYNTKIDQVDLITEAEVIKIKTWNATSVNFLKGETLLYKFTNQVKQSPDSTALIFENEKLTYKELDAASNQVANFLLEKGVKCNDIIAVSLERSFEMMIYIYGILKAGAAYLPLDTEIPKERLRFILNDANVKVLFYNHQIDDTDLEITESFDITKIESEIKALSSNTPLVNISSNDLAYVIYTSGSTGKPKGVKCHHEGICNRLNWMNSDFTIHKKDTVLQKTPITFDVSLWELFWPLQQGAQLVIEVPNGHKNPEQLISTIKKHQITYIHFVPSMLNVFLQTEGVETCTSINQIFSSGEALSTATVKNVYNKLDVELYNFYGPTEASVEVTSWHCEKADLDNEIPIGKPVANTQLYILDKYLNQLPIGLVGELHIAGKQVAKGYLNRETLTNERFIKDMFSDDKNAKMYKTGDLARYRADGAIEYLGRTDNQIKLRGLRIELGEIEKCIVNIEGITQAVVAVNEHTNLLAYYTGEVVDDFLFISELEQKLPEYMIPRLYVHLDDFEFLSSGKVDRKKLPKPNLRKHIPKQEHKIAPETEIEEIVHNVWVSVLEIAQIGVNENFIRIGGNSLDGISITSRLKALLELEVSITDVFNYPTIRSYSKHIENVITELLNE
ncbi:non-ribosomal peptide synthetase [Hyunsoonleella sp. 2307UL5-6]|uniref:non-ribosomal peptide synthetase n=1 Tax=Hyunsoonleella sp. 2307UL5-6 TaxID=3384768 RepID=UPI0039BC337C